MLWSNGMDRFRRNLVAAAVCAAVAAAAQAQQGGVYVAGDGFSFAKAAAQGLSANPPGQRFFLLALPPETRALEAAATGRLAATRKRVTSSGGVLMVCQRDVDSGKVKVGALVPGVVVVRGWPPAGSAELPPGERYFEGENRDVLPTSNEGLRRLRTTCSD
jgi:hypothetical protein